MPERLLVVLPTAGHGGCEYNALSFASFLKGQGVLDVVVAFPSGRGTAFLETLTQSAGLRRSVLPVTFEADDDAAAIAAQRRWCAVALDDLAPTIVFLALPWPVRGTGLISGFADLGVPTLVKFALVPETLWGLTPEMGASLRAAHRGRQLWFANSRHSAGLLCGHLGLPEGAVESFHVGPIGLTALVVSRAADPGRAALRASFGIAEDALLLTTVGRLSEQKGYRHFLDAIASLGPRIPAMTFLWVGEGELRDELESAIAARGLADRVILAGFRADVRAILRASDIFVLPTLYEGGCSQALLEAFEESLASIVSGTAGVREVVTDGEQALLAEPGSAGGLARQIERLASDGALRQRLGAAGRELSARLTPDAMYAETLERIDRLIEARDDSPGKGALASPWAGRWQAAKQAVGRILSNRSISR